MADSSAQILRPEPGLPTLQEKKIGNRGLKKTILRRGVTLQTPHPGDEVQVFYSGKVKNGPCLDPTGEKGAPLKFKLGQCEVIKGLDEGIGTMKKGEKAIFTVPPNLGYGEAGFPPLIPPDSTLIFDVEMISWTAIRDIITGDGGVMKKIIQEGEGWASPRDGDEVSVQFEARIENGVLVSKFKQGYIDFFVGDGSLCLAIHKAVKTMRKGEKAELIVRFSYGYGVYESARVGDLNPNVTIYLELMSWRSVVDVTGDKTILKKILAPGQGFDHPSEGSLVKVRYTGRHEDGSIFDKKGSEEEPFEYTCLEEQVNEGLDRAIMSMKKGEKAQVTMNHAYVHTNGDLKMIFDDTKLIYEIELVEFTMEKPFWKMETQEKIEMCKKKKEDGNALFKARKFWQASKKYEKALKYLEFNHSFTNEEKSVAKMLEASCYLNNAACKLKLEEYHEVSRLCSKVLEHDPSNVKALFRRSQAYLKTSELEKAEDDIKRALAIDPNNRDVKVEYRVLKDKQKEHDINQAKFFSTILSKMG